MYCSYPSYPINHSIVHYPLRPSDANMHQWNGPSYLQLIHWKRNSLNPNWDANMFSWKFFQRFWEMWVISSRSQYQLSSDAIQWQFLSPILPMGSIRCIASFRIYVTRVKNATPYKTTVNISLEASCLKCDMLLYKMSPNLILYLIFGMIVLTSDIGKSICIRIDNLNDRFVIVFEFTQTYAILIIDNWFILTHIYVIWKKSITYNLVMI